MEWFKVDKQGLAKLMERRGREFILYELVQNAWDADGVTKVAMLLERTDGLQARITAVDDSPSGFANMAHAYTLFAESVKKGDAEKRGRFNLGEKLILAMCSEAEVTSTSGTVRFDASGRSESKTHRKAGSMFTGLIELSDAELAYCDRAMNALLVPAGVTTTFNGRTLEPRTPIKTCSSRLPTEVADEDGRMRRTRRVTTVEFYEPLPGETAKLYEMGIPVVETGDRFHMNVGQKLILNFDRDNVTPAFLAEVRALAIEHLYDRLTAEDANSPWVRDAVAARGEDLAPDAVKRLVELRFGKKVVSFDMVDREANSRAAAAGFTVIQGGQMSGAEWAAVRKAGAILPAGQVTPSNATAEAKMAAARMTEDQWTGDMRAVAALVERIAPALVGVPVAVAFVNDSQYHVEATYGMQTLTFNVGTLGHAWFRGPLARVLDVTLHEIAHEAEANHLSEQYYHELSRLGGACAVLALEQPALFQLADRELRLAAKRTK